MNPLWILLLLLLFDIRAWMCHLRRLFSVIVPNSFFWKLISTHIPSFCDLKLKLIRFNYGFFCVCCVAFKRELCAIFCRCWVKELSFLCRNCFFTNCFQFFFLISCFLQTLFHRFYFKDVHFLSHIKEEKKYIRLMNFFFHFVRIKKWRYFQRSWTHFILELL